jgi:hypothetical protein
MIDHTLLGISPLGPANDDVIDTAGVMQGEEPEQP